MKIDDSSTNLLQAIRTDLYDWRLWTGRAVVIGFSALSGLTVVAFTWMTELAFGLFERVSHLHGWATFL